MRFTVKGINYYSGHCVVRERHRCLHTSIARAVDLSLSLGTGYVVDPDLRLTVFRRGQLISGGFNQLVLPFAA